MKFGRWKPQFCKFNEETTAAAVQQLVDPEEPREPIHAALEQICAPKGGDDTAVRGWN